MIRLEILDGERTVRELQFPAEPSARTIKIGTVATAHVRFLDDDQVTRLHAVIECNHDGIFLIDLGSVLGTFVNDDAIRKRKLVSGDLIAIGRQRLRFTIVTEPHN